MVALGHLNKSSIAPVELTILMPCLNENETIAAMRAKVPLIYRSHWDFS